MNNLEVKVLNMAYQSHLNGKRAEIPFHKICSDLHNAHTVIDSLDSDDLIKINFKAIGYVDFVLSDLGLSYCEEHFS